MGDWWRAFVERFLPWYEPARERLRDARTEAITNHSKETRERIIAEYREAAKASGKAHDAANRAGEAVIDEVRRDDH